MRTPQSSEADPTGLWAGAAGAVAGLAGIALSDLTSWLVAPAASPVPAVGSRIIDLLPAALVNWGKSTLGTADKPVLIALVFAGVLALCGVGGRLEFRRSWAGAAIFGGVAALGVLAVAAGGRATVRSYLPSVVGVALAYAILRWLVARLRQWHPRRAMASAGPESAARRSFLGLTAAVGVVAAIGAAAGRVLASTAGAIAEARTRLVLPRARRMASVPAGVDFGVANLSPYLTPNPEFYRIDTALQVPQVNPDKWTLRITGMVEREITLTYAELLARPLVEHLTTLTCVSNDVGGDLVGNARWLGFPVRDLLAEARPHKGADMVLSTSHDGWTAGTPLEALTDPGREALLAVGMNGEPLPLEHGYPVRLVVPGLYGYVSATKWVTELKVTRFDRDRGYWTPLGWAARGPIKLASRIDVPRTAVVPVGDVVVAGVAWAQHIGISAVDVQIDEGPWHRAELAETAGKDTWRQWRYIWAAPPGHHTIRVRATDRNGLVQTSARSAPAPDGATGYHSISLKVG